MFPTSDELDLRFWDRYMLVGMASKFGSGGLKLFLLKEGLNIMYMISKVNGSERA